jgi:hypothetical protein
MPRWALLQHTLPDASWHYDWLIQPTDTNPQAPLITFRTAHSPVDPAVIAFPAERIQDHRPEYLDYEGPVSNNRGQVRRIAHGQAEILRDDAAFAVILDGKYRWKGLREPPNTPRYQFHLSEGPDFE